MAAEGNGYIKLHRSILDWEWYGDWKTKTLFLHLLLTANHKEKSWQGQRIQRGQRVCSLAKLSAETGLSMQSIRTCLKRLNATGEITSCGGTKNTVITVNNYDKYQQPTSEVTNNLTSCQQTVNKQATNNQQQLKNDKNDKNVKNEKKIEIDAAASKPAKQKYGEYGHVLLTQAEAARFASEYGQDGLAACIKILDEYIETSGKRYKNHNLVLRGWVMDRYQEDLRKRRSRPQVSGSGDDFLANLAKALEADGHG